MKRITIYDTPRFSIVSYGNGMAYTFTRKLGMPACVHYQGDDALAFRNSVEAYEDCYPTLTIDRILARVWADSECDAICELA
jgi:hypothetical protein